MVAKYKLKEIPMISKEISIKIDKAIKEIWMKNIPRDFSEGYIINEDCLKMALCYYLRRKLSKILKGNSLYTSIRKKDVAVLFELKFTSETAQSTADWMKDDLKKLKDYVQKSKF